MLSNYNPNEVRIEIATTCNAKCSFCPHPTDSFTRKKQIISLEDYKLYLDKVLSSNEFDITDIGFSGFGEIFTDSNILDKLRYANRTNRNIHILSNGSMFSKEILDEIFKLENIEDIRISIHTVNELKYNKIMNFKSKKHTFNNVFNSIEYIINNKPDHIDLILTSVVDDNMDERDVKELIDKYGSRCFLEVWRPHNWIYGKEYRETILKPNKATCGRPFNGPIEVLNNGNVIMCCFDYNANMVLGNLKENSLDEIYNSDLFNKLQKHHHNNTCGDSDLLCNGCDQLYYNEDIILYNNRINDKRVRLTKTSTNLNKII